MKKFIEILIFVKANENSRESWNLQKNKEAVDNVKILK